MEEIIYLYIILIIVIIANIGVDYTYNRNKSKETFAPNASPVTNGTQYYTNSKIPWDSINSNVSEIEKIVADISNSLPLQFKLGPVLQRIMAIPNVNQNIVPSSANCSLVNSYYNFLINDTTADINKNTNQNPIVTMDGSVPSNILLNFTFPPPVAGEMGPVGPTGAMGPDGPMGPAGPMGVQGYWA